MQDSPGDNSIPIVAMVGCGYWGKNLARNFASLGALSAICDPDEELARKMADEYGVSVASWDAVLADKSIPAIALATPAAQHAAMAREALLAGKHVFVEKPIALRPHDAEELVQLAKETGRTLMVGHLLQYHPVFLKLKRLVLSGEIGRLQYVYSTRVNLGKIRREEDILWSFAPHDISMILSLVGEEPSEVSAEGSRFLHGRIWDTTITHLKFASGQGAHIFVSWLHPFKEQRLVAIGEKGMLVFDDTQPWDSKLLRYDHEISWVNGVPEPVKADAKKIPVAVDEPLKLECAHFLDCVASGKRSRTDGEEGLRVLRVLDAATNALQNGGKDQSGTTSDQPGSSTVRDCFVHDTAYVDQPSTIGAGTKIWHFSHVLGNVKIGKNCVVGQNVVVGPSVVVGNNCRVQNNVSLYKGVTLEDGVFCGPSCVFTNVNNPRAEIERKNEFLPTHVERGVTIGANATIVCGITLGKYCFIAAGAVVTKDVSAHALMAGVPAKRIGWVSHAGRKLGGDMTCPDTGQKYHQTAEGTLEEIISYF